MKYCLMLLGCLLNCGVLLADAAIPWTGAVSSDLSVNENWEGNVRPAFDETSKTGDLALFYGMGPVTNSLTMGSDLVFNAIQMKLKESGSKYYGTSWNFDLSGHSLRLYGSYNFSTSSTEYHALYLMNGAQSAVFRNGTLDFTGAYPNDSQMVMVSGAKSCLTFSGSELSVTGNPTLRPFNSGALVLSNGVSATGFIKMSRDAIVRITGTGTVLDSNGVASGLGNEGNKTVGSVELTDGAEWKNANNIIIGSNGYNGSMLVSNATLSVSTVNFGAGLGQYASNNTMRVTGGSKVSVDTTTMVNKGCISVGNGFNNLLEISGESTEFTAEGLSDGGAGIVRIGEYGFFNTFRVTDKASVSFSTGSLIVGMNENGVFRGDSIGNKAVVSGGASLTVPSVQVGAVMNRSDASYNVFRHRDFNGGYREVKDGSDTYLHSCSNRLVVSGAGTRFQTGGTLGIAAQSSLAYDAEQTGNGAVVTDGASLTANSITIGARGCDNFLTVGEGSCVTSLIHLTMGGEAATNTTVSVSGGSLRINATYYRLYMKGAADADHPTSLNVSEGGNVYAYYFQMEGTGNRLAISNGVVRCGAGFYFPFNYPADDDQTFEFAGTNSVLAMDGESNDFWFRGRTKFVFNIPAEGYSSVPIQGGYNIEISGTPTIEVNAKDYFRRADSRHTVLMQSGNSNSAKLNISDEALTSMNESVKPYNCTVKLSKDKKQLQLVHHGGMMLIVR